MGDVLQAQADLAGALTVFQESLAIRRHLVQADPNNAGSQRDLCVSQIKIGDVLQAQADLTGALATFQEALAIQHRLAEVDPSNTIWQRDLDLTPQN
ncbi:MAG: tetratricopeptide repeat protein [Prosthecobacter sp.]|nr:tetratricopeptide repeat protein [Prosthecobacter sp.]